MSRRIQLFTRMAAFAVMASAGFAVFFYSIRIAPPLAQSQLADLFILALGMIGGAMAVLSSLIWLLGWLADTRHDRS